MFKGYQVSSPVPFSTQCERFLHNMIIGRGPCADLGYSQCDYTLEMALYQPDVTAKFLNS